jgi:hypothetical protein
LSLLVHVHRQEFRKCEHFQHLAQHPSPAGSLAAVIFRIGVLIVPIDIIDIRVDVVIILVAILINDSAANIRIIAVVAATGVSDCRAI